jgi:8-oxo-dGTP pyrophosphatase MutT (NUDIX family)
VLGHCEPAEGSVACVIRELREEIGLDVRDSAVCDGLYAIEQVRPFYVWEIDSVVLGPRFAALVREGFEPTLNNEHSAHRWVALRDAGASAFWPGQEATIAEIERTILNAQSPARAALRVRL